MQVQVNSTHFQSFGGINFLESDYKRFGFDELIASHLGFRSVRAAYSHSDILKNVFFLRSVGDDALDDINTLREQLTDHPTLAICSADTIEYASQELKQANEVIVTDKKVTHTLNRHAGFNKLLPALCKKGGLLNTKDSYTIDYDGHVVKNTKRGNAMTYKKTEGYYPVVCSINKLPVYMENRKGNTPESYRQLEIITETINECKNNDIQIGRFRADACCYEKDTVAYLESLSSPPQYYIRAEMNTSLRLALEDETDWQPAMLNHKKVDVCAIDHQIFDQKKYRRIVAYRSKVVGQLTIDHSDGYEYHAVLTNDQGNPLEIINFYNHRGCEGEHHFKELDHDFGWAKLPFDTIEMNTVYMYATTVAYLLFNVFKHYYAAKLDFVKPQMRMKNFTLHFVTLVAKWIKKGRQWILKMHTKKNYLPLLVT